MKQKILIDCDPGHDDIMAILLALAHPEALEIVGYTTVCGNQLVEKVTRNLSSVLTAIRQEGIIAVGYDCPLVVDPSPQPQAHGESGLDGPTLPEPAVSPIKQPALEWLKETLSASEEKITIVALAPLTNIAILLKTYPALKDKIERITLMGGSIASGNILPKAEFNIYADPHAARIVFRSGVPLTMSPLEVCEDTALSLSEMDSLQGRGPVQHLAYEILNFFSRYSREHGLNYSCIYDAAPVMHLLHPEIFQSRMGKVNIALDGEYTRGMTVVDQRIGLDAKEKNVEVLCKGNRDIFARTMLQALRILDQSL